MTFDPDAALPNATLGGFLESFLMALAEVYLERRLCRGIYYFPWLTTEIVEEYLPGEALRFAVERGLIDPPPALSEDAIALSFGGFLVSRRYRDDFKALMPQALSCLRDTVKGNEIVEEARRLSRFDKWQEPTPAQLIQAIKKYTSFKTNALIAERTAMNEESIKRLQDPNYRTGEEKCEALAKMMMEEAPECCPDLRWEYFRWRAIKVVDRQQPALSRSCE